jgi:hypothetical protein
MRAFIFKWKENKKYSIERENLIQISRETGDIGQDAKAALNLFCANFGNLKKNEIITIQEVDEHGVEIGEPIKPTSNENNIVPYKKA